MLQKISFVSEKGGGKYMWSNPNNKILEIFTIAKKLL